MKHPTPEEWMAHLYGEDEQPRQAEMRAHLQSCAECAGQVKLWRSSMQSLDQWAAPFHRGTAAKLQPWLKWAAAAALMLGVGFATGRSFQQPAVDIAALKAELTRDFERQLAGTVNSSSGEVQRLLTEFMQSQDERRSVDRETIVNALRQLDAKYAANVATLRRELETVAVNTQDGLLETHQQLGLLASATQPPGFGQK